jgi:hypothetical protein
MEARRTYNKPGSNARILEKPGVIMAVIYCLNLLWIQERKGR